MIDDLKPLLDAWPVDHATAAVMVDGEVTATGGDVEWVTRLASISKILTAYAGFVALEEATLELDQPAGPPGATVRHLLAHAAGYGFDGPSTVAEVGVRRIYSNTGIEVFAEVLEEHAEIPFGTYLAEAVFDPLGMDSTQLRGSPAHGVYSNVADLVRFASEVWRPTLIHESTVAEATSVQFPALDGVVPGVGRFGPNPWGLGFEIRGDKQPHWTGTSNSPRTFGHFGGAGTFLWIDPVLRMATVGLTDRPFDAWALEVWPRFSDEMIRRYAATPPGH